MLHWWSAEPDRLSAAAVGAIEGADELAVAAITWYELTWLGHNDRISLAVPLRTWIDGLGADVRTVPIG